MKGMSCTDDQLVANRTKLLLLNLEDASHVVQRFY